MTKERKTVLLNIGKVIGVTLTLSFAFSFGFYATENYFNNPHGPDSLGIQRDTSTIVHIDTMVVPQTVVFYDTIGVYKVYTDTLTVEPLEDPLPPRPWGTKGRP